MATVRATKIESYALEVDGVRKSDGHSFVEAVRLALEIKQKSSDCKVRVCDASEPVETSRDDKTRVAA
jgi:hypothetical protein